MAERPVVNLAMTGASGAPYGLRLLEQLMAAGCEVRLMISKAAQVVISTETDLRLPGMEILSDPMRAEGAGYWWPVVGFALAGAVAVTVLNLVDSRQRKKNPALDEAREAQGSA